MCTEIASKLANNKLARLNICNCPCEPFNKMCSFIIQNELVNKPNNVKFGHSISLPEMKNSSNIRKDEIESSKKSTSSIEIEKTDEQINDNVIRSR